MKFAMYGSGAAGSVFASYMRKGGADIILIDRYEAHMKKVAEEGMNFTIHLQENGAYALCDKEEAQGISYEGVVYHVWGMPEIDREGVESVALVERDAGKSFFDLIQQNADLMAQNEMLTECILEMSEIVYG